jgi:hypothetical protein
MARPAAAASPVHKSRLSPAQVHQLLVTLDYSQFLWSTPKDFSTFRRSRYRASISSLEASIFESRTQGKLKKFSLNSSLLCDRYIDTTADLPTTDVVAPYNLTRLRYLLCSFTLARLISWKTLDTLGCNQATTAPMTWGTRTCTTSLLILHSCKNVTWIATTGSRESRQYVRIWVMQDTWAYNKECCNKESI